jgi:hypothetical protein
MVKTMGRQLTPRLEYEIFTEEEMSPSFNSAAARVTQHKKSQSPKRKRPGEEESADGEPVENTSSAPPPNPRIGISQPSQPKKARLQSYQSMKGRAQPSQGTKKRSQPSQGMKKRSRRLYSKKELREMRRLSKIFQQTVSTHDGEDEDGEKDDEEK